MDNVLERYDNLINTYKHGAWLDEAIGAIRGFIQSEITKAKVERTEEIIEQTYKDFGSAVSQTIDGYFK